MIDATIKIQSIVDQMDATIDGKYNDTDGKTYTCNTKWARVGKEIADAVGNVFKITEVEIDKYIVAEPLIPSTPPNPPLILDGKCFLIPPFFITGTRLATNREWTIANDHLENKLPLIWMLEVISETGYGRGSTIERDIDLRLFFLDETDPSQYYTPDHRKQVVQPMQKMMMEFLDTIKRLREFATVEEYRFKTFSRFGEERDEGVVENILDANLSGTSLEFTLSVYKENCKC